MNGAGEHVTIREVRGDARACRSFVLLAEGSGSAGVKLGREEGSVDAFLVVRYLLR